MAPPASREGPRPAPAARHLPTGTGFRTSAKSSLKVDACAPCARIEKSNSVNCGTSGCGARGWPLLPVSYSWRRRRIHQDLVRLRDSRKHLLGSAVARIDPRVIPPRQAPVRALDVRGARIRPDAQDDVEVHGGERRRDPESEIRDPETLGESQIRSWFGSRIPTALLLLLLNDFGVDHIPLGRTGTTGRLPSGLAAAGTTRATALPLPRDTSLRRPCAAPGSTRPSAS